MKLEFLDDISVGGKYKDVVSDNLVRLYAFTKEELNLFKECIRQVLIVENEELELHKQGFVEPLNCTIKLIISRNNLGISKIRDHEFVCEMNLSSYEYMLGQINTTLQSDSSGFVWLDDLVDDPEIDFLLSAGGGW